MRYLYLLLCLALPFYSSAEYKRFINFGWGGRLGDNLCDYTHAKWISYRWNIPLLSRGFEYSDQFVFDDVEENITAEHERIYQVKILKSLAEINEPIYADTIFFLPHVSDSFEEFKSFGGKGVYVHVDWKDEHFRKMMIELIAPKRPLTLTIPPTGIITVAIHYRCGGDFAIDRRFVQKGGLRFPNMGYYIQQLARLHEMVGHQPMYVYIFTDHSNPIEVYSTFHNYFAGSNIEFDYRKENNRYDANVLEDLFSLTKFDCLIRPCSHYSMIASHIGDFKIELYPKKGFKTNNGFEVTRVGINHKKNWDPNTKQWY